MSAKVARLMDVVCGDSAMSLEDGKWALKNDTLTFLPITRP